MARCTWVSMSKLLYPAALKVGGDTSDIAIAPESFQYEMQRMGRANQLHNPRPYDNTAAGFPNLFQPLGMYGAAEGQYFGDLAARSDLDQFGLDSWQVTDEQMNYGGDLYYDFGMTGEREGTGRAEDWGLSGGVRGAPHEGPWEGQE